MDSVAPRPGEDRPASARRSWPLILLLGLAVTVAGSLWGARERRQRRPPSPAGAPSSGFTSPFLNTRPGVKYVGSGRCAECHVTEAATYAKHPMGRSISPANHWLPPQHQAVSSFEASGLHYAVERRGDRIFHREFAAASDGQTPAELTLEIAFVVGSGQQGQSFLVNRDGYLFQSPISWYSREGAWRLSPNFERNNMHFNRYIVESCLFCHSNEARTEPDTMNHYRPIPLRLEPIGCERCHGPGALHVAARQRASAPPDKDLTIVNPRHLERHLREEICQQCHLAGEARIVRRGRSLYDYRPGLPLHEFASLFVHPLRRAENRKAVSQVEQMYVSRCFQASGGEMGCTSCHDPHVAPSARERVAWYRGRCLHCHQDTSCSLSPKERRRRNRADSCIDCHMPRGDSSNIAHASVTDHRIVRRPGPAAPEDNPPAISLVPFHRDLLPVPDSAGQRDLGLALVEMMDHPFTEAQRRDIAHRASRLLAPVVESTPDDVPALEGLGIALWKERHSREALATLEKALRQAPRDELALEKAARIALEVEDYERSVAYWRRLVEVNPYTWENHGFLAQGLAFQHKWTAAVDECRAALRLNPFETRIRMLLIDMLIRREKKEQARAEFETLLALRPPNPDRVRRWFSDLMRLGN